LTGGTPANLVYVDGVPDHKVGNENLVDELETQIRAKAAAKEAQMAKDSANLIVKN
jgi:(E)-4-hydroxy-3-methylbut-2-enyl-diphosphate synthase